MSQSSSASSSLFFPSPLQLLLLPLLLSVIAAPTHCDYLEEKCQKCGQTFFGFPGEFFNMEIKEDSGMLVKGRAHKIHSKHGVELYHVNPKIVTDRTGETIHDGKCVMLKVYKMDGDEEGGFLEYMRDSQIVLESLAKANAKRIIRTYANKELYLWMKYGGFEWEKWSTMLEKEGKLWDNNKTHLFLSIMEAGKYTLAEYWERNVEIIKKKLSIEEQEKEILGVLEEILLAVEEFHQIAIHNDLATSNFVYVDQANGLEQPVLKLIDFDSVKLLPKTTEKRTRRANVKVTVQKGNRYQYYASPELTQEDLPPHSKKPQPQVSTKSDIYAVGKILMEMVSELVPEHVYKGTSYWDFKRHLFTSKVDDAYPAQKHVEEYIRANYRHLYEIFKAMTAKEPTERPTALGLLQLLKGKCQLKFDGVEREEKQQQHYAGTNCDKETTGWTINNKMVGTKQ